MLILVAAAPGKAPVGQFGRIFSLCSAKRFLFKRRQCRLEHSHAAQKEFAVTTQEIFRLRVKPTSHGEAHRCVTEQDVRKLGGVAPSRLVSHRPRYHKDVPVRSFQPGTSNARAKHGRALRDGIVRSSAAYCHVGREDLQTPWHRKGRLVKEWANIQLEKGFGHSWVRQRRCRSLLRRVAVAVCVPGEGPAVAQQRILVQRIERVRRSWAQTHMTEACAALGIAKGNVEELGRRILSDCANA
mmetsp:Transcript_373/g.1152  ORF Transcript_373/g.1152 Transcript_373/m.1152 type:complete len:242 (+) Transcript_373:393-1118(+)